MTMDVAVFGAAGSMGTRVYFVTNPAHPPIYNGETDPEARRDYFGSGKAKQAIVKALMQGPEETSENTAHTNFVEGRSLV